MLGQAVIFKDLCFMEQVDGGSEFLVIKNGKDGCFAFESWSTKRMVDDGSFEDNLKRIMQATDEQLKKLEY